MRTAFIQQLTAEARKNDRIFLVVGDLGYSVVEPFAKEFPDRFLNAGVAEQNMTGVAAGLASEGWVVFTYSIANFPTLRCLEQIRNDVAYHNLPVTVVAVGGGMAYGNLGYSHHAVQDLAVMRTLPNFTVFAPADPAETRLCVTSLATNPRPSYLRIGKAGEPELHQPTTVESGLIQVRTGATKIALVSTGGMLKTAIDAWDILRNEGLEVAVYSLPRLKPISQSDLAPLTGFTRVFSLEEHIPEGGLGAILREFLPRSVEIVPSAIPEDLCNQVGSQTRLCDHASLSARKVVAAIKCRI